MRNMAMETRENEEYLEMWINGLRTISDIFRGDEICNNICKTASEFIDVALNLTIKDKSSGRMGSTEYGHASLMAEELLKLASTLVRRSPYQFLARTQDGINLSRLGYIFCIHTQEVSVHAAAYSFWRLIIATSILAAGLPLYEDEEFHRMARKGIEDISKSTSDLSNLSNQAGEFVLAQGQRITSAVIQGLSLTRVSQGKHEEGPLVLWLVYHMSLSTFGHSVGITTQRFREWLEQAIRELNEGIVEPGEMERFINELLFQREWSTDEDRYEFCRKVRTYTRQWLSRLLHLPGYQDTQAPGRDRHRYFGAASRSRH
ncbi:hypothetical protein AAMO2058_000050100 [Amorphochlora amoebiformis]